MDSINFGVNYYLPDEPTGEDLAMALATIVTQVGISFDEATEALRKLSQTLQNVQNQMVVNQSMIFVELEPQLSEVKGRLKAAESEIFDHLRPDLDALIEKSNQKTDLEKIEPIIEIKREPIFDTKELDEWYDNFMKEFKIIL